VWAQPEKPAQPPEEKPAMPPEPEPEPEAPPEPETPPDPETPPPGDDDDTEPGDDDDDSEPGDDDDDTEPGDDDDDTEPGDDDDDDDWGDEDDWGLEPIDEEDGPGYQPPFVVADFSKPQPAGYVREPAHDHRWFFHNLTAVRVNPLGLTNRFRTGYKMQLSHRPEAIFKESYATIELDTEITPAFGYAGARMEIQPAKIFNFWASYGVVGSFGTFSYTRSFPNTRVQYNDDYLEDTRDQDYSTIGHKAILSGMFQFGLGGVAMRNNVKGHFQGFDLEGDDVTWYDPTLDVLMPNQGWVITNDADLLVITEFDLIIGLRYTVTHAIYRDEHLARTNVTQMNENTPTHRVGPALIYEFFDDGPGTMWNKPSLVLLTQWWAKHRYRTSENPALPYVVLAFVQQGDLMISDKE
jgi:hypothetical protein